MSLKSCCCGCTLKTGCLIIGILQSMGGGLAFGSLCRFILGEQAAYDALDDLEAECQDKANLAKYKEVCEFIPEMRQEFKVLCGLIPAYLVVTVLSGIAGCLLIHGTKNAIPKVMNWWVYITVFATCVGLLINIVHMAMLAPGIYFITGVLVGNALSLCLTGYFIAVVRSFRQQLVDQGADLNMFHKF